MTIEAVIFDLDGVLVSTDEYHYQGWKRLADEEGILFTREDNHRQRGVSRMASLEVLLEKAVTTYNDAQKKAMASRKNAYYCSLLETLQPSDVLPGARELLEELRAKAIRLAVGSSSGNTPLIMEKVDLTHYFDAVADGNDISRSKPDPEVFLLAAKRLALPFEACVVVEDAEAGVEAARRAGMRVYAIGPAARHPDVVSRSENLSGVRADAVLTAGK